MDAVLGTIQAADSVDLSSQRSALIALGSRGAVLYRLANDDLAGGNGGIIALGRIALPHGRATDTPPSARARWRAKWFAISRAVWRPTKGASSSTLAVATR